MSRYVTLKFRIIFNNQSEISQVGPPTLHPPRYARFGCCFSTPHSVQMTIEYRALTMRRVSGTYCLLSTRTAWVFLQRNFAHFFS